MSQLHWLDPGDTWFPPSHTALRDPDGLLAVGGDLTPERLVRAYSLGIFPWYNEGQPLLWWTPDPRMILLPQEFHCGRSLRKLLRKQLFTITVDRAFAEVMQQCGTIARKNQDGSWITQEMLDAYIELHRQGIAHSVEAWQNGTLVGGLYGIALGRTYFGESMFSLVSGASKAAFSTLVRQLQQWRFELIDCQIKTNYLAAFGAREIPRAEFEHRLGKTCCASPSVPDCAKIRLLANSERSLPIIQWRHHWQMPETGFDGFDEA